MIFRLLAIVVINVLAINAVYSRPTLGLTFAAKVLHVCSSNVIIVENEYTRSIDTVVIAAVWPPRNYIYEQRAVRYLNTILLGNLIDVQYYGRDKFGRIVGHLHKQGQCAWISYDLIAQGLTYWNKDFDPGDEYARTLEARARHLHLGVWK